MMVSKTNERELEKAIERTLTGSCQEDQKANHLAEPIAGYNHLGYVAGSTRDFNKQYALDTHLFWQFLQTTQSIELAKIQQYHPNDWQQKITERFDRLMKKHGLLYLLKKGIAIDDIQLQLMYPAPLASSSDQIRQNFAHNVFSVTRQLRYSTQQDHEIDMVLFINGLPIITIELKNAWTGQTARYHGQKQYREDRDTHQTLFHFGRCLVHFAVDTDEVYMTTKLEGKNTFFLPFNKGNNFGAGNPPNSNGHKTAYLWQNIFTKESLANIIQHFVRLDGKSTDPLNKRTLYFPRYHQLDVVRKLVAHANLHGTGQTYLIQHSAGSGKSNSITWTAYQLIEVYPANEQVANGKNLEQPLFDSVIVVTDRRLLDKQLRDNIREFSEVKNIVAPALSSSDLKTALHTGKKIIITTIQKFPFIIDGICDLSDKRFAVIIDEAHSSQNGDAHGKMNMAMGKLDSDEEDIQDKILQIMQARKMRGNASYFAFTATPKNTTLEKFGQKNSAGKFEPFHLYSMKQAIEEGFILDVLANYTTYKSYYEIQKSIVNNPLFDSVKAQKRLRAYVERSQQTIDTKAEIMLEHFIDHVVNTKKLKGKGKGMVVTQNIETAIRYYKALTQLLAQQGNPFKILIAFSGEKDVDGITYSEAQLNGFSENDTKDHFDGDAYRLLIVANKYLTGFDQPKLCTLYVDKKLTGVLCVQTLSRLNRSAPKWGKKTEDLFVLDFFNAVDDIKIAFDEFYTATSLSKATDVNVLHDLKNALDTLGVYEWHEIETFIQRYFNGEDAQTLSPLIDTAVNRFDQELELLDPQRIDFKVKAKQFVKIYGQMASIIPYQILHWEKLYWFLKFLIPKLNVKDPSHDAVDELLSSVDLSTYALERVKLNVSIALDDSETELDPQNPNPRGVHTEGDEKDPLDDIIKLFNERWFNNWGGTPEEARVKFISVMNNIKKHADYDIKYASETNPQKRDLVFDNIIKSVMLQQRAQDLAFYKRFVTDDDFKLSLTQSMKRMVESSLSL